MGADVKRKIIFSKDFWQSSFHLNGASYNMRLQSALDMALKKIAHL